VCLSVKRLTSTHKPDGPAGTQANTSSGTRRIGDRERKRERDRERAKEREKDGERVREKLTAPAARVRRFNKRLLVCSSLLQLAVEHV